MIIGRNTSTMELADMLDAVRLNHAAALDALAEQVQTLREAVELQRLELQQQKELHENTISKLQMEQESLQELLQQTQLENQELSATVHLLNDELNAKSLSTRLAAQCEEESPSYNPLAASHTSLDSSMNFSVPTGWDDTLPAVPQQYDYNFYPQSPPQKLKQPLLQPNTRLDHELRRLREKLGVRPSKK
ncbi:hypothetical protein THRCLA_00146 [Thraustotheca clavata]|uniref:Uncharacterized protein n=1 Tax=Thraustotheca clavata TaxID=74557 RepID=A0A1W0ACD3_9STRA|nr:hypothetical protein THRCLA_00146 [Thraustotheca clavata]